MKLYSLTTVTVLALLLGACSTPTPEPAAETMENTETLPAGNEAENITADDAVVADDAMVAEDAMTAATEMTIDMFAFGYSVEEISASPGETITVNLTNSGGMHDFDIDELDVDTEVIEEGETNTVTFTIPADAAPGTEYAYYCSVGNHRAQGMEGTITVQ